MRRLVARLIPLLLAACGSVSGDPVDVPALRLHGADGEAAGLWLVDLGEAPLGETAERTLTLRNEGEGHATLALTQPDAPFAVELASPGLAPGAATALVVRFVPDGAGQREAVASIAAGDARIDLRLRGVGKAGDASCLAIEPDAIDFGGVIAGCEAAEQIVSIVNRCDISTPVDFRVVPDGPIHLVHRPAAPVLLAGGDRLAVELAYTPWAVGVDEAGLLVGAGAGSAHRVELGGTALPRPTREQVDQFAPQPRHPLDVLVVVDDTEAMAPWKERFAPFAAEFSAELSWTRVDLRLAVTTSSFGSVGACGGMAGMLLPSEAPEILTHELPAEEFYERFLARIDVDTCVPAGASRPLEAALTGFSQLARADPAERQIIILAGEDDQGTAAVADLASQLEATHPRTRVEVIAVHPTTACGASDDGTRLVEFTARAYGQAVPICSASWMVWNQLRLHNWPGYFYSLAEQPVDANGDGVVDEADLVVEIDGEVQELLPSGERSWTWDPHTNDVRISPFLWTPHQTITIRYRVAAQLLCDG